MNKMMILLSANGDIHSVPVIDEDPMLSIRKQIGKGCEDVRKVSLVDTADFSFPVCLVSDANALIRLNLNATALTAVQICGNAVIAANDGESACGMTDAQTKEVMTYLLESSGAVA